MTHVTCRLTARNRDQLRNPAPGNRVSATFYTLSWSPVGMRMGINLSTPHTSTAPSTCQPASHSRTVTSGDWHRCNATLATREETARDRGLEREREGGGRERLLMALSIKNVPSSVAVAAQKCIQNACTARRQHVALAYQPSDQCSRFALTEIRYEYDTIRDAVLTCAQKAAQFTARIPRNQQLKSGGKKKKRKVKTDKLRRIGEQSGESLESVLNPRSGQ